MFAGSALGFLHTRVTISTSCARHGMPHPGPRSYDGGASSRRSPIAPKSTGLFMPASCSHRRMPLGTLAALALLLASAAVARAASYRATPLLLHDATTSPLPAGAGAQHFHTYLDASGILFLSANTIAEYVLHAPENNLLVRDGRQVTNSYLLTISLFDIDQKRLISHTDVPVPGKFVRVFRSAHGGLLLVTHSWIAALSPSLETIRQVPIDPRFGTAVVASDTDIDDAYLYLTGESSDGCPKLAEQLNAASLATENSWCFQDDAPTAFYRTTALQFHAKAGADLHVFRDGRALTQLKPPSLFATTQAIPLSSQAFLLTNGVALINYSLDAGLDFFSSPAKHGLLASPIHCSVSATTCATALAIPKADPLVLSLTTTYKRIDLVTFDTVNGRLHSRHSILALFKRPTHVSLNDFSDLRVALAPHGERAAAWHGSTWVVFNIH